MKATIKRKHYPNVTTGLMLLERDGKTLDLKTIELPWKDNKSGISCIPSGTYSVKWVDSPRLKKKTYRVLNVQGRDGILFHPANYAYQLKGCIAPCLDFGDIDKDGVIDGTNSRTATELFEKFFGGEDFELTIL